MQTSIRECPNCGAKMEIRYEGELQDKVLNCPSCGTTIDVKDKMKRVKKTRRYHVGGQEIIEEEVMEYRSDGVSDMFDLGAAGRPTMPATPPTAPTFQYPSTPPSLQVPQIILLSQGHVPTIGKATTSTGGAACVGWLVILLVIGIFAGAIFFISGDTIEDVFNELENLATGGDYETLKPKVTIAGHSSTVDYVQYSPDGKYVASSAYDGIGVWDARTGQPVASITEDSLNLSSASFNDSLSFDPTGKYLATVIDYNIYIFEIPSGKIHARLMDNVYSAVYSPDGETMAVFQYDPDYTDVVIVDAENGRILQELVGEIYAYGLTFSPDGKYVVANGSSTVGIWDTGSGFQRYYGEMEGATSNAQNLAFQGTTNTFAIGSGSDIYFYEIGLEQVKQVGHWGDDVVKIPQDVTSIQALAFSPDGKHLAYGDFFGGATVWDVKEKQLVYRLETADGFDGMRTIDFSATGNSLVGGGFEEVIVWEIRKDDSAPTVPTATVGPTSTPGQPAGSTSSSGTTSGNNTTSATHTPTSTRTPGASSCLITPVNAPNIRQSPSTNAAAVSQLRQTTQADGQYTGTDGLTWWRLADGRGWVREDVVNEGTGCTELPIIQP